MLSGAMVAEALEPEAALRWVSPLLEQEPHRRRAADERNLLCSGTGSDSRDQVSEMSVRRHRVCVRRLHQHGVNLMGAKPRQNLVQGFREGRDLGLGKRIINPNLPNDQLWFGLARDVHDGSNRLSRNVSRKGPSLHSHIDARQHLLKLVLKPNRVW